MKTAFFLMLTLFLTGSPALAQLNVVVSADSHCGTAPNGQTLQLPAGTHEITLDGAYSVWSSDISNNGNTWITGVRAHISGAPDDELLYAESSWQSTPELAAAEVSGMVFDLSLTTDTDVTFYVFDAGCGDNRGSVTVTVNVPTVAVDQSDWGLIKRLYR